MAFVPPSPDSLVDEPNETPRMPSFVGSIADTTAISSTAPLTGPRMPRFVPPSPFEAVDEVAPKIDLTPVPPPSTKPEDVAAATAQANLKLRLNAAKPKPKVEWYYAGQPDEGVVLSSTRPATALKQALQANAIDKSFYDQHIAQAQEAETHYEDLQKAAGSEQELKAIIHGGTTGGAFLTGARVGARSGATLGEMTGPAAPVAVPVLAGIGALTVGTIAQWSARKGLEKLADYNDAVKSLTASAELHPIYDEAGTLIAFASSGPKSVGKLAKLYDIAEERLAGSGAKAVLAQTGKGAVAGAIFEGALRPTFDAAVGLVQDQFGIEHGAVQAPTMKSYAINVGLGILTAGHSLDFKGYRADEIANLTIRGSTREKNGIGLTDDVDPQTMIAAFEKAGAKDPSYDYQKNGLLRPLTPAEADVYLELKAKMHAMKLSGLYDDSDVTGVSARQAFVPGLGGRRTPLSSAVVTTEPRGRVPLIEEGAPHAVNQEPVGGGVPVERPGTVPQQPEQVTGGPPKSGTDIGNRLPDTTGKPPAPFVPPPPIPTPEPPLPGPKPAGPPAVIKGQGGVAPTPEHLAVAKETGLKAEPGWGVPGLPPSWAFTLNTPQLPLTIQVPVGSSSKEVSGAMRAKVSQAIEAGQIAPGDVPQNLRPPTPAQAEAGNFPKTHINVQGLDIAIENPAGSIRKGTDKSGKAWQVTMPADYGYIKGVKGKDKDHLDVYVGPNKESQNVYVIDQINPETKQFDEHKVMLGFDSSVAARDAYQGAFSDGRGRERRGAFASWTMDQFKEWLKTGNKSKPVAYLQPAIAGQAPVTPPTKISPKAKLPSAPTEEGLPERPPSKRWTPNVGSIPGEPAFYLDGGPDDAKAAIIELDQGAGYQVWNDSRQPILKDGKVATFETLAEAAKAAEALYPAPIKGPSKTEVKSPLNNLSAEDQKKAEELKNNLLKMLGGRMNIPGIDPEILTAAVQLANLYAKGGVKTFEQFARHVHEEMPSIWERIKAYLRNVWNQIADLWNLKDVTREEAEAVFSAIEKPAEKPTVKEPNVNEPTKGGSGGGGVGGEQPTTPGPTGEGRPTKTRPSRPPAGLQPRVPEANAPAVTGGGTGGGGKPDADVRHVRPFGRVERLTVGFP